MVSSKAKTVTQYIKEVPKAQRDELVKVREVVKKNLRKGFVETMNWGMITYEIPLETYPVTYNGKPLMFVALAAQKNYLSLYMMCIYQEPEFLQELEEGFKNIGVKPNMGKSCIRFKKADQIPLPVIGRMIKKVTMKKFIESYENPQSKTC